jgi:hypothetical protein
MRQSIAFSPLFTTEKMNEKMRAAALGVEEALEMLRKRREEIRRADAERGKRAEEDSDEDGNGSPLFTEKMRAAALGVEEALEMLRKRREEIRRADVERGKRAEEDSEEDGNGSLLSEGGVLGAGPPKVGSSHEVKLVHLKLMKNNDGMVTVLEKEEEDDGKKTKKTKSSSVKMMMALRYTHERAPAADARKPVRVVRRKNNTTTNNNERGVVEIEFRNKEEEKSGIRYRGVTSTSGGGGGGGRATTKTKKKKKKSDGKEEEEKETADDADEDEDEDDEDDEDDDNVECAILFDGKTIELRVLDETVAGLRVQRKREDEEESGIVSKRLDIGDAADVKNKRKKVNL